LGPAREPKLALEAAFAKGMPGGQAPTGALVARVTGLGGRDRGQNGSLVLAALDAGTGALVARLDVTTQEARFASLGAGAYWIVAAEREAELRYGYLARVAAEVRPGMEASAELRCERADLRVLVARTSAPEEVVVEREDDPRWLAPRRAELETGAGSRPQLGS